MLTNLDINKYLADKDSGFVRTAGSSIDANDVVVYDPQWIGKYCVKNYVEHMTHSASIMEKHNLTITANNGKLFLIDSLGFEYPIMSAATLAMGLYTYFNQK